MFKTAVALVELATVIDATVIPAPKLAIVVPCWKCVFWPVIETDSGLLALLAATRTDLRERWGTCGDREPTRRSLSASVPVVNVTVRGPSVAAGSMLTTTVAVVGALIVSETIVTPAPKFAMVVP